LALNIKNAEADELARRLAQHTGRGITDVVIEALREKLSREEGRTHVPSLAAEILAIGRHCASLPVLDSRSDDEILGYDQRGLWS
jgi:antitoxin VapB